MASVAARGAPSDLRALGGVGPARAAALARLGVACVRDLALLVPRRLEVWPEPLPIAACSRGPRGGPVTVAGHVVRWSFFRRGRRALLRLTLADGSGELEALFFNQPWLRQRFKKGDELVLHGRLATGKAAPVLAVARFGTRERPLPAAGTVVPLYPTTE